MTSNWHRILLIVDDDDLRARVAAALIGRGWDVIAESNAQEAVAQLREERFACTVVADGEARGLVRDVLTAMDIKLQTPVVAGVKAGDVTTAVDAMRLGATSVLELAEAKSETMSEAIVAAIEDAVPTGSAPFLGRDPRDVIVRAEDSPLNRLLEMLPQIATSSAPVLISGESGTGKELVARTIHNMSPRADGPFVAVNCSAIPESLLESELFGYKKGAFTGAHRDRDGFFVAADGGTILLDEIGEMPPRLQVKLLRVLQEKRVLPVGATEPVDVDFRIVAASNRNLEEEIGQGNFREDLYYRIGVLPVHIAPLRERPDDVIALAEYFLAEQNRLNDTRIKGITRETLSLMKRYEWPGNVRELQNLVQRLCILKRIGFIERDDLPPQFLGDDAYPQQLGLYVPSEGMDMAAMLERLETQLLRQALDKAEGNKAAAARLLGLNRTTLVEKVKRLKIE